MLDFDEEPHKKGIEYENDDLRLNFLGKPISIDVSSEQGQELLKRAMDYIEKEEVSSITSYKRVQINGVTYHSSSWSDKFTRFQYCFIVPQSFLNTIPYISYH